MRIDPWECLVFFITGDANAEIEPIQRENMRSRIREKVPAPVSH